MASTKTKVNPEALKVGAKRIRSLLTEYETLYTEMLSCLDELDIDDTQKKALKEAASSMKKQFDSMKTYMESGIVELFESAAEAYESADSTTMGGSWASSLSS